MNLPVPSAEEVEEFRRLYLKHRGEDLDPATALDLATRFLHFYFFCVTPPPEPTEEEKAQRALEDERRAAKTERMRMQGKIGIRAGPEKGAKKTRRKRRKG